MMRLIARRRRDDRDPFERTGARIHILARGGKTRQEIVSPTGVPYRWSWARRPRQTRRVAARPDGGGAAW